MDYIAVLSYEHLDNGLFLTSFAKALAQKKKRGIILHESSEYTERIIQTGVMRDEATIRCLKELNHRLVALFADEGVSTISLNGHQKELISTDQNSLDINFAILEKLPQEPVILISALAARRPDQHAEPVPVSLIAEKIRSNYNFSYIELFSTRDNSEIIVDDLPQIIRPSDQSKDFLEQNVPSSFHDFTGRVRLHSASTF